jgi:hypothetical protein
LLAVLATYVTPSEDSGKARLKVEIAILGEKRQAAWANVRSLDPRKLSGA